MKKAKYKVITNSGVFESNSRNARKHLIEGNYSTVIVMTNKGAYDEAVSRAIRHISGMVLYGASK